MKTLLMRLFVWFLCGICFGGGLAVAKLTLPTNGNELLKDPISIPYLPPE